jgi:hypothetical protein
MNWRDNRALEREPRNGHDRNMAKWGDWWRISAWPANSLGADLDTPPNEGLTKTTGWMRTHPDKYSQETYAI